MEGSLTGDMITFLNKIKEKKAASIAAHMTDPGEESLLNDILSLNNSICVDNDRLYLCNESAEATEFNLSDVSGKILMIGTLDSKGVDISSLNQGVYLVRTNNGGSFKFIK